MWNTLARSRDRADILARLRALGPHCERRWGTMSVEQMVCHLSDWSRMALGEKPVRVLRLGRLKRTAIKWFALWLPVPWARGLTTSAELDQRQGGGTRPGGFDADRAEAVALLERLTGPRACLERQLHPFFGPMSERDWLRMAWLHTDHHLRQFGA